ncbi:hypothetical protein [Streptomyces aurantiogriseus]|uniref:Uncharacterized protein n=1 Tax=Streptomyces aurantiogriseus TaxID=66870 RepID=A0A918CIR8_9ACTN|nr:hypothetical protein [Streptomyces aurantiogriseus]GGR26167.1 hypothetical protein GCM10010251_47930 [Streptomyces aurantiogriseus]
MHDIVHHRPPGALPGAVAAPAVSRWIGVGPGIAVGAVLFPARCCGC